MKKLTYTFQPEIYEIVYNPVLKKRLKDIERQRLYLAQSNKSLSLSNITIPDVKFFRTEKVNRQELNEEQPLIELNTGSFCLKGHSNELAKEGLTLNLYEYIDMAYEQHNRDQNNN